jgi:hypothetical protein
MIVALAVLSASAGTPVPSAAEIGKTAPAFTLTDISGTTRQLSDFKGKIVVLEWTNPYPFVQRVYRDGIMTVCRRSMRKGVIWLAINSTSTSHGTFFLRNR